MPARKFDVVPVRAVRGDLICTVRDARIDTPGAGCEVVDIPGSARAYAPHYRANRRFCGGTPAYGRYEYTFENIGAASTVDESDAALAARDGADRRLRDPCEPALPSTMGRKKPPDPRLRTVDSAGVPSARTLLGTRMSGSVPARTALRAWMHRLRARRQPPAVGQKCLTGSASKLRQPADFA